MYSETPLNDHLYKMTTLEIRPLWFSPKFMYTCIFDCRIKTTSKLRPLWMVRIVVIFLRFHCICSAQHTTCAWQDSLWVTAFLQTLGICCPSKLNFTGEYGIPCSAQSLTVQLNCTNSILSLRRSSHCSQHTIRLSCILGSHLCT